MKYFLLVLLLACIFLPSCKKEVLSNSYYREGYGYVDTAYHLGLFSAIPNKLSDTTGNCISQINMAGLTTLFDYNNNPYSLIYGIGAFKILTSDDSLEPHKYTISYVGDGAFIDSATAEVKDSIFIMNGTKVIRIVSIIEYQINRKLFGKPVFEIYDIEKKRLFAKVLSSPYGIKIEIERSLNNNENVQKIAAAFNYYISKISASDYYIDNIP